MNPLDVNVHMVEKLARHLGELKNAFVFVGGCATGLLITDAARPPVRATTDVDLIARVTTHSSYYALGEKLRERGFREDKAGPVLCRWQIEGLLVDIMPADEAVLGFTNRWYSETIATAVECELPNREVIRLITAPLFIATKLEAFHGRGNQDYGMSHDMEDIVTVVDGRPELADEIARSSAQVQGFLQDEFEDLLGTPDFVDSLSWHLPGDVGNQARVPLIIERMRKIAGL